MNDHLKEQSQTLVTTAHINAVAAYRPVSENFPFVRSYKVDKWDFYLTIAGVFLAISQLNHEQQIAEEDKDEIREIVTQTLHEEYQLGIAAIEDCTKLVDHNYDLLKKIVEPEFVFPDCVGIWIMWNLAGTQDLSEGERQLTRVLGGMIDQAFYAWWR